ncbi:Sugar transferase involved in LPS biosynthesis (colanic, teichoic acid) [Chryseobacterium sp. RU37D]|uniref:sugar transferase n=1 Tax=Chryseobacterium sp. RU37D TaxID=1907397 RepID=UPI00095431EB|nr:sugar transferase [Chryseobacterium sp. RU37D]SIQ23504.1 Sugar transferase involved in LPS biosynthesis (colanic, teichoic acid) [Chryseobacterium sp. RU37D]
MNQYRYWKVIFDCFFAAVLIILFLPLLIILFIVASVDTRSNGIFCQKRIGQYGKLFIIYKFKTIRDKDEYCSKTGSVLRKYKLDELPQLFNIIKCEMSFVGPRPDIEGYYDKLQGDDRKVLELKPGITSEASIKYSNEETILKTQNEPLFYNDEVLFPDKVKMNLIYLENMSLSNDIKILAKTIIKIFIK